MTGGPSRGTRGGRAWREGHAAEWIAALWLMLKGYQVLAFRLKGRGGEIDILARRGRVLAAVEVKRRDLERPRYPANGRSLCLTPGISLRDRGYQFWFAASTCLPWIAAVVAITTVLSVAQKVVMDRQKRTPQPLGSR